MKLKRNRHLSNAKFEEEMFAYRYIMKVVIYLIIPLLCALMVYEVMQHNYSSIAILAVILATDFTVLIIDRTSVTEGKKIKINGILFKTQIFSFGLFLLYVMCIAGEWDMLPWTFAFCYLALLMVGIRAGGVIVGVLSGAILVSYIFFSQPDHLVTDLLMIRFFSSLFLCIILIVCTEYVRTDYRRKLVASEEKYRRLYEQLSAEVIERKKTEATLRKSESQYRLLADNITDNIWVLDLDTLRFSYVSPSVVGLNGYSADEAINLQLQDILTPSSLELATSVLSEELSVENQNADTFRTRTLELEQYHKNGTTIWTEVSMRFIRDNEGRPTSILGATRDISERRKLQSQLQQAERMETIGTLAGGVAHDLNNILSGIVSYPELILMDLPEDSPLRKPILTIKKSGEKAAVIVQDLLTLARRGVSVTDVMNLNHIVTEQLKSPEFDKLILFHPDIQVKIDFEKDLLNIKGSYAHLSKSVMNILSNAAEAMPDGGTISISTENVFLERPIRGYSHIKSGEYVIVTVSDTGMGIPEEDFKKIFEPFYTKKVMGRSGTGLGMAVVWGTVKDHKGYIDIQSTLGKGTTFTLYFPVTRKEISTNKSLLSIEDYMGKGEKILVVDDAEEQREIATGMLNRLGYSVTSVSCGEEAIEYLKTNSADLILLDMIMEPGLNGRETYERIKTYHPNQKAIIASGFSQTDDVKITQKLGAGAYIKKPYTLEKIGLAVRDELTK